MSERGWLADRFEADRPRLQAMAARMLGSSADAEMPCRRHGCG